MQPETKIGSSCCGRVREINQKLKFLVHITEKGGKHLDFFKKIEQYWKSMNRVVADKAAKEENADQSKEETLHPTVRILHSILMTRVSC